MESKVLIVDDEPSVCELLRTVLESAGMKAHAITDSRQAAESLQREKFDAVFLDVRMPPPDGIELARQMRAAGFNQRTPLVMITADDDHSVLQRAFEAGANFFLFKPIDSRRLLRVLRASQASVQREKRRFQRVPVSCKVTLESDQRQIEGTTSDLSLGGMLARAADTFPLGVHVALQLQLVAGTPALKIRGRCVRVTGDNLMGIEFLGLGTAENERLQEFLLPLILKQSEGDPVRPSRGQVSREGL